MPNVTDIINETKALVAEKRAQYEAGQTKSALAGKDPSSYPGAEHDKPNTDDQSPSPEVGDKNWTPKGVHNMDGKGDDSSMTRGHATDATQPPAEPTKKPEVTTDANAKTAEQADDLLSKIRAYQASKQAAADDTPPAEGAEKAAAAATPPPAAVTPAEPTEGAPAEGEKAATGFNMALTQEVLAKMASFALATEEGVAFMEQQLSKAAGAAAAAEMLDFIQVQDAEYAKIAAFEQGAADAELLLVEKAAGDRADRINKIAAAIRPLVTKAGAEGAAAGCEGGEVGTEEPVKPTSDVPETPEGQITDKSAADDLLQAYYKLGQEIADASIQAGLGGELGGEAAPPPEMMPGMEGDMGAGMEGGGEEEELAAALEQLVAEGVIGEEELAQILQVLEAGGAEGGAPAEGMPAEEPPAEEPPAEEPPADEPPAEAGGESGSAEDKLASNKTAGYIDLIAKALKKDKE